MLGTAVSSLGGRRCWDGSRPQHTDVGEMAVVRSRSASALRARLGLCGRMLLPRGSTRAAARVCIHSNSTVEYSSGSNSTEFASGTPSPLWRALLNASRESVRAVDMSAPALVHAMGGRGVKLPKPEAERFLK